MEINNITIDTHSLLWYVDKGQNRKLSPLALDALTQAEENGIIYVPVIVLMETLFLMEKGRFFFSNRQNEDMGKDFGDLVSMIEESASYQIVPIDASLLKATIRLKGMEIHDRLILATAILTDSVLVSKDKEIRAMNVSVIW